MPVIGSGKFITSAIVSDDGQPITSDDGQPIASDDGQTIASDNGKSIASDDGQPIASDDGQPIECATSTSNSPDNSDAMPAGNGDFDKKVLQWKLSLHQIGSYFCYFVFSLYIQFMLTFRINQHLFLYFLHLFDQYCKNFLCQ